MLIKCNECNTQVSDKAITCPNCGAKVIPVLNGVEYFFKHIFSAIIAYWAILFLLVAFLSGTDFFSDGRNASIYIISLFGWNIEATGTIFIAIPLGFVTTLYLAYKQSIKSKDGK